MRSISIQTSNLGILPWLPEASIDTQSVFASAVFNSLLKYDEKMVVLPGIFRDFNWDASTSTYVFKYDRDLVYHNGRKIDPVDIEFAIAKLFLTKRKIVRKEIFNNIVGVEALNVGTKFRPGIISGIRYDQDGNFSIKIKKPNHRFLYSLANSVPGVGPRDLFGEDLFSFKEGKPIGLGKYKVKEVDKERVIVKLERVNHSECNSSNPCPNFIRFVETGDPVENNVDIAGFTSARPFYDVPDFEFYVSSLPMSVFTIDFNFRNKTASNIDFREAVSLAISREKIVKGYKKFKPTHHLITSHSVGRVAKSFKYSPSEAKSIVKNKFGKVSIKGWFHGPPGLQNPDYIESIRKQLEEVGIKVEFSPTLKQGLDREDVGIFVYGTGIDYSDPSLPIALTLESQLRRFHLPLKRDEISKMYDKVLESESPEEKANSVKELLGYFMDIYLRIPLAQGYKVVAINKRLKYPDYGHFAYTIDFDHIRFR